MIRRFADMNAKAKAIAFIVIAIVFLTLLDACAKRLSEDIHTFQVIWARYFFQTLLAFVVLAPQIPKLMRTYYLRLQLLRSSFLFGATLFFFFGLNWLPLSETAAIFEVAPLLITLFAFLFLKEKIGMRRWWGVGIGLIGAMIIIRPGSSIFSVASFFPIASAACFAAFAIATRVLGREEDPWTSFLYTALIGTIAASVIVPFFWTTLTPFHWMLMIVMGAVAGIGHYLLIKAFSLTDASFLAPFGYLNVFFNTIWGFLFFFEIPSLHTVIGAFIIIGAGLYVWRRENKTAHSKATEISALPR